MKENFAKYPDLMVCSDCFRIYRFGDYISPRLEYWRHWQKCDCSEKAEMPEDVDEQWTWFDFNKRVELCYCCGKVLLKSGSKWNFFFCDECRQMVKEFNWECGRSIIPVAHQVQMAVVPFVPGDVLDRLPRWRDRPAPASGHRARSHVVGSA